MVVTEVIPRLVTDSALPLSFRGGPTGPNPESRDSGFDAAHRPGM